MKHILSLTFLLVNFSFFSQQVLISDPDQNPLDCSQFNAAGVAVFFDNGGDGGNYTANANDEITLCPDLPNGPKLSLTFVNNTFGTFDIHPSDTLYVYDGPTTGSPLLGKMNNTITPNGGNFISSFENNPTGCLTLQFISNGSDEGTGWGANLVCTSPPQPFTVGIEAYINGQGANALNPLDTGYVDICFEDSILFIAKPNFLYSLENTGSGYSQNLNNVQYEWEMSNGWTGQNNDSVWFKPNIRSGFYLDLQVRDGLPFVSQTFCKVRVSQIPTFNTTRPLINPICPNEEGIISGGANVADTVGVEFPPGSFLVGGTVAGLTALPDGSGLEYTTIINISDFADTQTFVNPSDLVSVCLDMEHTFLGDLEIWLECPSGQEVSLINSYAGGTGHIPDGFGGGGTYLGDANDGPDGIPGVGMNYCFSPTGNTFQTMGDELTAGNTILASDGNDAMNPDGVYLPDGNIMDFVGCPLNGDWTIHVRDNLGIDDGFIFEWALFFDGTLYPNYEEYQTSLTSSFWSPDPTITQVINDTAIRVNPVLPGTYFYQFNVVDNYGCPYDTTVSLTVKDSVILISDFITCDSIITFGSNVGLDGVWSNINSTLSFTANDINDVNSSMTLHEIGTYNLLYDDPQCIYDDTIIIRRAEIPDFNINSTFFHCPNDLLDISVNSTNLTNIVWDPSVPQLNDIFNTSLAAGTYNAEITNVDGCTNDTTFTITTQDKIITSAYPPICDLTFNMTQNTPIAFGTWNMISGPGTLNFNDLASINTTIDVNTYGTYLIRFSETTCQDADTVELNFVADPTISLVSGEICLGGTHTFVANSNVNVNNIVWDDGSTGYNFIASQEGNYTVTASNLCGSIDTTVTLTTLLCSVEFPNVFTPNSSDILNQTFNVLGASSGIKDYHCQIFNRWGNLVFEYTDLSKGWDGKDKNGKECTPGVYFYKAYVTTFKDDELFYEGNVHLIRD